MKIIRISRKKEKKDKDVTKQPLGEKKKKSQKFKINNYIEPTRPVVYHWQGLFRLPECSQQFT